MHILFITDNFYPEGNAIASRVYERACYWVKWGHQVTVITSAPNFPEGKLYSGYKNKFFQKEMIDGIQVIRVKTFIYANKGFFLRIIDFLSFMPPAFLSGLCQPKPDVIVSTSPQFFGAIAACLLAKCRRVPFVLELGDIWPASIVGVGAMKDSMVIRFLEKLERLLYRGSQAIVVVTPVFKVNLITKGVAEKKISVILNGVDLGKYKPQQRHRVLAEFYGVHANDFVVGYIGTHGMAHGLSNVLEAAKRLESYKNIKILFVGAGAERAMLINKANSMGLENVQFISAQPKERINDFWSLCNVALVHLKNTLVFSEVIPSKIFEAMGMGLPVLLVAPQGIASEMVVQENVGRWVQAEEPQLLAEALIDMFRQPEQTQQIAQKSLAAASMHSRETQARLFLTLLESISQSDSATQ